MKTRLRLARRTACAAALLLCWVASSQAAPPPARRAAQPLKAQRTFSRSVEYSGYIGKSMVIEGVVYRVAPNVSVYVLGRGLVAPDLLLSGASIYLSGEIQRDGPLVRSILVRPGVAGASRLGDSRDVSVLPEGAPF